MVRKPIFLISFFLFVLFSNSFYGKSSKSAIVIGASSGIGRELAKVLSMEGYAVGIASRKLDKLNSLADEIGEEVFVKQIDISKFDDARERLNELIGQMVKVDLIVINAGFFGQEEPDVSYGKDPLWAVEKRTIDVNVSGFVAMANSVMAYFKEVGHGHLVGVSSVDAVRGICVNPSYSGSKAFISNYMQGLRSQLDQAGIDISITDIRPGYVSTYEPGPEAYWVATAQEVAPQIYDAIAKKKKVAYVTKRWQLIAWLLMIAPDFVYDSLGGF
ncbi:SDR family NAD(P)-dependent oxidoreductase [bacterium]|jgi:short-subunit dehydrogenase|nr:SDR family NAD(P)-dependent oxidoreductase [bacterium]